MGYTNVEWDEDVHERMRHSDKSIKDIANEAARLYFGLGEYDDPVAIQNRIKRLDKEIVDLEHQRTELDDLIQGKRNERETLVERLETLLEEANTYEDDLNDLLNDMQNDLSLHVFADYPRIQKIARAHDSTPDCVIESLQKRSEERDLSIGPERFEEKRVSVQYNGGVM